MDFSALLSATPSQPASAALAMKTSAPALSLGHALSLGLALLSSAVGEQCSVQMEELREQMTALLREQTETLRAELRDTKSQLESKIEQQAVRDLPYVRQISTFYSLGPMIYLNISVGGAVLETAQLLIRSLSD